MIIGKIARTLICTLLTIFISCQNEEDLTPIGKYEEGVFISNEGNFTDADGSTGFFNDGTEEVSNKIFEAENGRPFGGLLQSIGLHGEYAYLIDNLGSKIEIVDAKSFDSIKPILTGLSLPRYFEAEGTVGFISNWGPYADDFSSPESFIAVMDTENNVLGEKIEVPSRPEGLIISNGNLYVSSLASESITVFNVATAEKISTVTVGFGSSHFVKDNAGKLWVACTNGSLVRIDPSTNSILDEVQVENLNGKIAIDGTGETIYVLTNTYSQDFSYSENEVIKLKIASPQTQISIFSARNLYGIGVHPTNDIIYLANSNAFLGNGTIIRIDDNGTEIDNFQAGRGPNGFVFSN